MGFAELSPELVARNNEAGRATSASSTTSTAVLYPSGVFGGPSAPPNGSVVTGSPLSPTSPSSALAAANDLKPTGVRTGISSDAALSGGGSAQAGLYLALCLAALWALDLHV